MSLGKFSFSIKHFIEISAKALCTPLSGFQLSVKMVGIRICFVTAHFLIQRESEPNPNVSYTHAFSALDEGYMYLLRNMIGSSRVFGFAVFDTQLKSALYRIKIT